MGSKNFSPVLNFVCLVVGITEENLNKLFQHGSIPQEERSIILNMRLLGPQIVQEVIVLKLSWFK